MIHIAILLKPYLDLILSGQKTIECRLTRIRCAPFEQITLGERIYFKQSSGLFRATAVAGRVTFFDWLSPVQIREIRRRYNDAILGEPEFWRYKARSRYGTLIWLQDVAQVHFGPKLKPQPGRAWFPLDDAANVYPECLLSAPDQRTGKRPKHRAQCAPGVEEGFTVVLTAGNLRNNHVYIRSVRDRFPRDTFGGPTRADSGRPIKLMLQDGPVLLTDIVDRSGIFRVRQWGAWFKQVGARAGDALVLVPRGRRRFEVKLRKQRRR